MVFFLFVIHVYRFKIIGNWSCGQPKPHLSKIFLANGIKYGNYVVTLSRYLQHYLIKMTTIVRNCVGSVHCNRFQQVFLLFLCLLILLNPFSRTWVVVSYKLNESYISQNLCENKDKPQLKCNGKCHLKKQLAQSEQAEQKTHQNSNEKAEVLYCSVVNNYNFQTQFSYLYQPIQLGQYAAIYSQDYIDSVFHPPTFF